MLVADPPNTAVALDQALSALHPADRALVSLCFERGLEDERLAAMSGVPSARLRARRARMLARLASLIGTSPEAAREALLRYAASRPAPSPRLAQPPPAARRSRRRVRAATLAALAALAAGIAILAAGRADGRALPAARLVGPAHGIRRVEWPPGGHEISGRRWAHGAALSTWAASE